MFQNFCLITADTDSQGNSLTGAHDWTDDYDLFLQIPPLFSFQTNSATFSDLLTTNATRWLLPANVDCYPGDAGYLFQFNTDDGLVTMGTGQTNWFGLSFVDCIELLGSTWTIISPGSSANEDVMYSWPYIETAYPKFQTVKYCFYRPAYDYLPGSPYFSPTNDSPLLMAWNNNKGYYYPTNDVPYLIVPVGTWTQLAGYAKLRVTNGASWAFGYLGQYFQAAYQLDGNGNVTTNSAGVVSPYGYYFPTAIGTAELVTMPDPDTGAQGTCTVYSVSLALDKNHDGTMDLSVDGPDATSSSSPYVFWCNNNFDRYVLDADDNVKYDDSIESTSQSAGCPYSPSVPTPDCNYLDGGGNRVISCGRDLEDFARLWVCGVTTNLLSMLPVGSTVTFSLQAISGNPSIDLFVAADANGGIGYLTNQSSMSSQLDNLSYPYMGRIGAGASVQIYGPNLADQWAGNHYIWCGVSDGTGALSLTIRDSHGKILANSSSYIKIVDVKQMYERWTVGDIAGSTPLTNAIPETESAPAGYLGFQYPQPAPTNTPYILFVHGWNMDLGDKDNFAESAFKRLYWQGYQGRFGAFYWPTYFGFTGNYWSASTDPRNFDYSENVAWLSPAGLLNQVKILNSEYPGQVYLLAHSMGNVVTGEALRLAGNNQLINTYVASQAAISAHAYDGTVTTPYLLSFNYQYPVGLLSELGVENYGPHTPDIYIDWLANNGAAIGRRINYYNVNDFALAMPRWGFDQITKPDYIPPNTQYTYNWGGSNPNSAPWNNFYTYPIIGGGNTFIDIVTNLNNHYKIFAYAGQSYSTALGATPGIVPFNDRIDLTTVWPSPDPLGNAYSSHFWHSAQFRGDSSWEWNYWNTLLFSSQSGFGIRNP